MGRMGGKKAVVLTSGGVDSSTVMAMAGDEGYEVYCLSFSYGQRHALELEAAKKIAVALGSTRNYVKQLGRAACRGRGEIAVVAVALKKKERHAAVVERM